MNKLCNRDAIMKLAKKLEGNEKEDDEEEGKEREEEHLGGSTESQDEYGESGEYFENSKLPEANELPPVGSVRLFLTDIMEENKK